MLSIDALRELLSQSQGLCVSMFIPLQPVSSENQHNLTRFKDLIQQTEHYLQTCGIRQEAILALLEPAQVLHNQELWQNQSDGVAVFLADGCVWHYQLPILFEKLVVVGDRFHLKPLIPVLNCDEELDVLTLNQEQIKFLKGK